MHNFSTFIDNGPNKLSNPELLYGRQSRSLSEQAQLTLLLIGHLQGDPIVERTLTAEISYPRFHFIFKSSIVLLPLLIATFYPHTLSSFEVTWSKSFHKIDDLKL